MTDIAATARLRRISRLGPANPLPQFRLERHRGQPPRSHPSLTSAETSGVFAWGSHPILPYLIQDDYDRSQAPGELPALVVENDALRLTLYPELGGRLASLYDRRAEREVLFDNPVFQPANLAVLNAWFSGGVEWNGIIPGHSPFTCAPVFAARVQTDRGPLLRLYEFERIREAVWQVDLYLPPAEGRLWVHGRLLNPNPYPIRAYWWTNIAAPLLPGTRVLAAADYCVEHVAPDNHLAALPFPRAHGFDGSYPENYGYAASVFFRPHEPPLRPWLAALQADGYGLLHVSTAALPGRKLFVFGQHAGGLRWMDFLSLPGQGAYIEVQAGALPTQDQEFIIAPGAAHEWTECLSPFAADPGLVHQPDFDAARRDVDGLAQIAVPQAALLDMDRWLHEQADAPITELLHTGAPWGGLHERLTGLRLSPGLAWTVPANVAHPSTGDSSSTSVSRSPAQDAGPSFSVVRRPSSVVRPWTDLLADNRFSPQTLAAEPSTWAVSPRWVARLEASRAEHGTTWLHELFLGVAWLNEGEIAPAREHFTASLALHANYHAQRGLALIAYEVDGDVEAATAHYLAAWELADDLTPLAVEICRFFQQTGQFDELEAFLARLPESVRDHERIALARGQVALQRGETALLAEALDREFATVREGETLLTELWFGLHVQEAEARLGHVLSDAERAEVLAAHPMPYHLDFRMVKE